MKSVSQNLEEKRGFHERHMRAGIEYLAASLPRAGLDRGML